MGIKISELEVASSLNGDEVVAVVQGSETKQVCVQTIGELASSNITSIVTGHGLQGGGSFGAVCVAMDNNCIDKFDTVSTTVQSYSANWDSNYTTVQSNSGSWDQSSCVGIDCVGTVTGFDSGGDGIDVDDSDPTSIVIEVDSTVVRTSGAQTIGGNKKFSAATTHCGNVFVCNNSTIGGSLYVGSCVSPISADMVHINQLHARCLPTSDPGVPGVVWNDGGDLKISQ